MFSDSDESEEEETTEIGERFLHYRRKATDVPFVQVLKTSRTSSNYIFLLLFLRYHRV